MKSDEYPQIPERLTRAISFLEIAEDQLVEARSNLQLADYYVEADELRFLRKSLTNLLSRLRNKVEDYQTPL